ncbi:MAG TPA: single-stranded DNA-binding protein [Candidatus Baltobacteraceae bacterium]|nr:single-stranded DNA-binding protein [Candidatus Baltobacteraceae bacterium]
MAGSYNRVILVGNLTRDPEIRYTQSGKAVTKFTLAVNNPRNKEETTFVDIVAWDRLGETCNTYLKKGSSTLVEGRLVIRSYDDKDGNKRKATEVVIDNMQMLTSRGGGSGEGGGDFGGGGGGYAGARSSGGGAANGASAGDAFGDELDDEIPF